MHPLDLLKVKFQVAGSPSATKAATLGIYASLKDILRQDGFKGLWRGLGTNVAGNASSWGFYFLW
jgi:solute carrier family 25 folate transporter 32